MTVIAWDGKTLAADKQMTSSGLKRTTTKIWSIPGVGLLAITGLNSHGLQVREWFLNGRASNEFPYPRDKDNSGWLIHIDMGGVLNLYCDAPLPLIYEDKFTAFGSGRDYALASMHLGCDSAAAVGVACLFDDGCGMGMDSFELALCNIG